MENKKIIQDLKIQQLLKLVVDKKASDLHLSIGNHPCIRIDGLIHRIKIGELTANDVERLFSQIITENQRKVLREKNQIDFSFAIKNLARFRANIFRAKLGYSAVFRIIPSKIPLFQDLGLPESILNTLDSKNGLILITGPTGSGKTTTLASLINHLNHKIAGHIITLEDPIEFFHSSKNAIITQREIGTDVVSFEEGVRSLLRQDPDIILIGELRDLQTIESALKIAETGHLVFATLHTNSAVQTINRLINVFPAHQQEQIRNLLSFVLRGIISQQLIPKSFSGGRCLGLEVLYPNHAIKNLIRENKVHQIYSQMQIGQDTSGMMTMNQSLKELFQTGMISQDVAIAHSPFPEELLNLIRSV